MQILNVFHVLITIAMIAFILIQKGAGATAGAAFGSGASGTVFGSRGAGNFLSRSTWVLAALFCLISLSMAVIASRANVAPESDLGVVATTTATEETTEQTVPDLFSDLPAPIETEGAEGLPSLDTNAGEPTPGSMAGDVPTIEAADTPGPTADEDPAAGDGY